MLTEQSEGKSDNSDEVGIIYKSGFSLPVKGPVVYRYDVALTQRR